MLDPPYRLSFLLAVIVKAHTYVKFCEEHDGIIGVQIVWVAADGWMKF